MFGGLVGWYQTRDYSSLYLRRATLTCISFEKTGFLAIEDVAPSIRGITVLESRARSYFPPRSARTKL